MTVQELYPHTCPGYRCAICAWVIRRAERLEREAAAARADLAAAIAQLVSESRA